MTGYDLCFRRINPAAALTLNFGGMEDRTKTGNHLGGQWMQWMQKKQLMGQGG